MSVTGTTLHRRISSPVYGHLVSLSDDIGLFEHADGDVPRQEHGYCVDDVARALIVAVREPSDQPGGDAYDLAALRPAFRKDGTVTAGNSSGINVANIDNLGNVHPDTMWWHHTLGNVRERAFGEIWNDVSDPLMAGLKALPRNVGGRCGSCAHFAICGGNTRVRAQQLTGNAWAEDPGCYLTDEEIGAL